MRRTMEQGEVRPDEHADSEVVSIVVTLLTKRAAELAQWAAAALRFNSLFTCWSEWLADWLSVCLSFPWPLLFVF